MSNPISPSFQLPPSENQLARSHECRYGKEISNNGAICGKCSGRGRKPPRLAYDRQYFLDAFCYDCQGTGRDPIPWSELFSGWSRK